MILTYPLTVDDFGRLSVVTDYPTKVKQAIVSALLTEEDERVYRPEYGRDVQAFDTSGDVVALLARLRDTLALGLEGYPDVTFELSGSLGDTGALEVEVYYQCPDADGSISLVL